MVGVLGWRLLEERRWWLGLGAVAGLVLVVLSASRAAQAALLVACVVAVVLGRRTHPRPDGGYGGHVQILHEHLGGIG